MGDITAQLAVEASASAEEGAADNALEEVRQALIKSGATVPTGLLQDLIFTDEAGDHHFLRKKTEGTGLEILRLDRRSAAQALLKERKKISVRMQLANAIFRYIVTVDDSFLERFYVEARASDAVKRILNRLGMIRKLIKDNGLQVEGLGSTQVEGDDKAKVLEFLRKEAVFEKYINGPFKESEGALPVEALWALAGIQRKPLFIWERDPESDGFRQIKLIHRPAGSDPAEVIHVYHAALDEAGDPEHFETLVSLQQVVQAEGATVISMEDFLRWIPHLLPHPQVEDWHQHVGGLFNRLEGQPISAEHGHLSAMIMFIAACYNDMASSDNGENPYVQLFDYIDGKYRGRIDDEVESELGRAAKALFCVMSQRRENQGGQDVLENGALAVRKNAITVRTRIREAVEVATVDDGEGTTEEESEDEILVHSQWDEVQYRTLADEIRNSSIAIPFSIFSPLLFRDVAGTTYFLRQKILADGDCALGSLDLPRSTAAWLLQRWGRGDAGREIRNSMIEPIYEYTGNNSRYLGGLEQEFLGMKERMEQCQIQQCQIQQSQEQLVENAEAVRMAKWQFAAAEAALRKFFKRENVFQAYVKGPFSQPGAWVHIQTLQILAGLKGQKLFVWESVPASDNSLQTSGGGISPRVLQENRRVSCNSKYASSVVHVHYTALDEQPGQSNHYDRLMQFVSVPNGNYPIGWFLGWMPHLLPRPEVVNGHKRVLNLLDRLHQNFYEKLDDFRLLGLVLLVAVSYSGKDHVCPSIDEYIARRYRSVNLHHPGNEFERTVWALLQATFQRGASCEEEENTMLTDSEGVGSSSALRPRMQRTA